MRKSRLKMSISVDGFVGGRDGEIDWLFNSMSDEAKSWQARTLWDASLHIMGSSTFRGMIDFYPASGEIYAAPMNAIPKAYFSQGGLDDTRASRSLADAKSLASLKADESIPKADWANSTCLTGPLRDEIETLKLQDGKPILAHGGAGFAQSLIAAGLVDEFFLLVHPLALGRGLPIFSDLGARLDLTLTRSTVFAGGTVAQEYTI